MKTTSTDSVRCEESNDVSFNDESCDDVIENRPSAIASRILAGVMELGKEQNGANFEVGLLDAVTTR